MPLGFFEYSADQFAQHWITATGQELLSSDNFPNVSELQLAATIEGSVGRMSKSELVALIYALANDAEVVELAKQSFERRLRYHVDQLSKPDDQRDPDYVFPPRR